MKIGTPSPGQICTLAARIMSALPAMTQAEGFDISQVLRHTEGEGEKLSRTLAFAFRSLCDGHASCVTDTQSEADASPNIITVDDSHLAQLITLGQYWYANENIVEYRTIVKNGVEVQEPVFLHDPSETGKWKWSFWSPPNWMSTDDVRSEVERKGLALAKVRQSAAFGAAHPYQQLSGPIIGLGSVCQVGGESYSPDLWCSGGLRRLSLYRLDGLWSPNCRFLCVEPVDSAA